MVVIFFNDNNGQDSYMSPFSKHPITEKGVKFQSVYHYYTYNKFNTTDPQWAKETEKANLEKTLIQIGNSRRHQIIPDWDSKKYGFMKRGYELKFQQHKGTKQKLINLKASVLKYNAHPTFKYWGSYGQNMLGKLLMELKKKYTEESSPKPVPVKKVMKPPAPVFIKSRVVKIKAVQHFTDMLYQVPVPVLPLSLAGPGIIKFLSDADKEEEVLVNPVPISKSKSDNEVDEIISVPVPVLEMSLQEVKKHIKDQTVSVKPEPKEELKILVQQLVVKKTLRHHSWLKNLTPPHVEKTLALTIS
jgi:ribA/ribD-fused uncharacterized protein